MLVVAMGRLTRVGVDLGYYIMTPVVGSRGSQPVYNVEWSTRELMSEKALIDGDNKEDYKSAQKRPYWTDKFRLQGQQTIN